MSKSSEPPLARVCLEPIMKVELMKRLHVSIAVSDLDSAVRFYSTLFGAEPTVLKTDYAKWMIEDPRVNLSVSTRGTHKGVDHLGIQVDDEAELATLAERLARLGPFIQEYKRTTCCYAKSNKAWVQDPEGIAWETFHTFGESTGYSEDHADDEANGKKSLAVRSLNAIVGLKNRKAILTPGPGSLLPENLVGIVPCFGRGDPDYQAIESRVLASLRKMTGHDRIVRMQGSPSLALEIAIRNFVAGRTLLINTGYYADRLAMFCRTAANNGAISQLDIVPLEATSSVQGRYDWLVTVFTETS